MTYCLLYRAPIYSSSQPARPRGYVWAYRANTDVKYSIESVIEDFSKKHPHAFMGTVEATFFHECPVALTDEVFVEYDDIDEDV
jgi:hypothetical protein